MHRLYRWCDAFVVLASQFKGDLRRWGFHQPVREIVLDCARDGNDLHIAVSARTNEPALNGLSRADLDGLTFYVRCPTRMA